MSVRLNPDKETVKEIRKKLKDNNEKSNLEKILY